jgi:hypothetical protein
VEGRRMERRYNIVDIEDVKGAAKQMATWIKGGEGQNLMLNPAARAGAREIRKLQISYIFQISYSALTAWIASNSLIYLVRMKGLEPSLPCEN